MANYRFSKTIFSELNERIVAALRNARKEAGLTQVQAAERLGCRQTFLSKIECGEQFATTPWPWGPPLAISSPAGDLTSRCPED